jgi:hypothetical protein
MEIKRPISSKVSYSMLCYSLFVPKFLSAMADAETIVSKRLIISGLTPAIDADSLIQRLSSFGNVHSLVGVGLLDANGKCLDAFSVGG